MIAAVVPCFNEESSIGEVLDTLISISIDLIVVVANGCTDNSIKIIQSYNSQKIALIAFTEPLGLDVPRAIGAKYAHDQGATVTIFVDGDMAGDLSNNFKELINAALEQNIDLALTNCYPTKGVYSSLAQRVLCFRYRLNNTLGYSEILDVANPCHGPHTISRNFLSKINCSYLAKPPMLLTLARTDNRKVGVGTVIPHKMLGSKQKNTTHNLKIADTIIGDCLEAINLFKGTPLSRYHREKAYEGYNPYRRLDLLWDYLISTNS